MIEYFYAVGDSFSFGQELAPHLQKDTYDFTYYHRKKCFSGIMADSVSSIKYYRNKSLPGGSNERSYRKIITNLSSDIKTYNPESMFVTVGITHALRREFYINDTSNWYPHMYTFAPRKEHEVIYNLWELLTTHVSADEGIYIYDMMQILGIQNYLIKNKIPYLLTSSLLNDRERDIIRKVVPDDITDQLYSKRYYDDLSFYEFTKKNNYSQGPGMHPLEEAHESWANHLLEYIYKHDLFSNKDLL
jgi:hypothetical protein